MTPIKSTQTRTTYEYSAGLLLDVVRAPDTDTTAAAIVWLHGGGWSMQDRAAAPDLLRHFAADGFVMVSIDYRLAPAHIHPAQLFDVRTAIRWLRENAAVIGIDGDRIGLWGSSAGGHLGALAGAHSHVRRLAGEGEPTTSSAVQAVVVGYGPSDLTWMVDLPVARTSGEEHTPEAMLLGGAIRDRLPTARDASPALQVRGRTPPYLLMHGRDDHLVPYLQSERLFEALQSHGNDVIEYLIDGFGHGFFNPGDVLELGPGVCLDQGHLERDPTAPARVRFSTDRGRAFVADHPYASFDAIRTFFTTTLQSGDPQ